MFRHLINEFIGRPLMLFSIGTLMFYLTLPRPPEARTFRQASSVTQDSAEWDRYSLKDGTFSVLLPTIPAMSSYASGNWDKTSKSRLKNVIGAYYQGVAYAIEIFQVRQSLEDFIADSRRSAGSNFKRDVTISEITGKEYGFESDMGNGVTQFFLLEGRVYIFKALGSRLGQPVVDIPRFFDSIKFEKSPAGLVIVDGPGVQPSSESIVTADRNGVGVLTTKEITQKARVISKPEPTYTDEARQNQITGTVVLRGIMSSSGEITNLKVLSALPHGLTEKAISAAYQIKFIPAIKDGKFVSMYIQIEYNFNLY